MQNVYFLTTMKSGEGKTSCMSIHFLKLIIYLREYLCIIIVAIIVRDKKKINLNHVLSKYLRIKTHRSLN